MTLYLPEPDLTLVWKDFYSCKLGSDFKEKETTQTIISDKKNLHLIAK